jgi:hypothetical protein
MRIREAQKNRFYESGTLIPDMNPHSHLAQRIDCNRIFIRQNGKELEETMAKKMKG